VNSFRTVSSVKLLFECRVNVKKLFYIRYYERTEVIMTGRSYVLLVLKGWYLSKLLVLWKHFDSYLPDKASTFVGNQKLRDPDIKSLQKY